MNTKIALVTGTTGQDGSYLCELLLSKGYQVHGIIRRSSSFNTARLDGFFDKLHLHYGDLTDAAGLRHILSEVKPDLVFNLGSQSHVQVSFKQPSFTAQVNALGTINLLEAVRDYRDSGHPDIRYYQASSSEMFGDSPPPQNESTPFRPRSPYACAKLYAHWQTINYREAYGLFASNGILFNHESPRRGETFVTRKITRAVGRIKYGLQDNLVLGNLGARRDWGFAGDYADAIWRILQHDKPDDFVIATGESRSVSEWLNMAFEYAGFRRQDVDTHVCLDDKYKRPTEVAYLRGDASKAKFVLGWEPTTRVEDLCRMMVAHDLELASWEAERKRFLSPARPGSSDGTLLKRWRERDTAQSDSEAVIAT